MNVSCGSCPAKYAVPDEKVRGRKVRIHCKRCGAAIVIDGSAPGGSERAPAVRAASAAPVARVVSAAPVPATTAAPTAASARNRDAIKRTMMGVAPPALGSSGPPVPAMSAGTAGGTFPQPSPVARAVAGLPVPPVVAAGAPADARSAASSKAAEARREMKRTMVGGLEAPALLAARSAALGESRPAVVVSSAAPQPPPAEPALKWTVAITDEHHEEMSTGEAVALFAAGTINEETYIWKEGMPDWQMPFEIPEIAAALRVRGFVAGQTTARPGTSAYTAGGRSSEEATVVNKSPLEGQGDEERSDGPSGVWREPGSWNERGAGGTGREVSFDDVTVSMGAPQAEELLRAAEAAAAREDEATHVFNAEASPLDPSEPPPEPQPPPELASRARQALVAYDASRQQPGFGEEPDDSMHAAAARAAERFADESPRQAVTAPRATERLAQEPSRQAAARRASNQARVDLFADPDHAGMNEPEPVDEQQMRMTGARNESSVLFSLDALVKAEQPEPKKPTQQSDEAVLMGGGPSAGPRRDNAPDSLINVAGPALFSSALSAPDVMAPVAEAPALPVAPASEMAPPSADAALVAPPASAKKGGAILLVVLLGLVVLVGGAAALVAWKRPDLVDRLLGRSPPAMDPTPALATTAAPAPTPVVAPSAELVTPVASGTEPAPVGSEGRAREPERAQTRAREEQRRDEPKPASSAAAKPAESAPAPGPAPAAGGGPPFDKAAAVSALATAAGSASSCKVPGGPTGGGRVVVTFAPSGRATNAVVSGDLAGTAIGGCVARVFRTARVPAFSGEPTTVARSFTVN